MWFIYIGTNTGQLFSVLTCRNQTQHSGNMYLAPPCGKNHVDVSFQRRTRTSQKCPDGCTWENVAGTRGGGSSTAG